MPKEFGWIRVDKPSQGAGKDKEEKEVKNISFRRM